MAEENKKESYETKRERLDGTKENIESSKQANEEVTSQGADKATESVQKSTVQENQSAGKQKVEDKAGKGAQEGYQVSETVAPPKSVIGEEKKAENPLEEEGPEINRNTQEKAGEWVGFKSDDFSSSGGDIINFMYTEVMKGVDWTANRTIDGIQWGCYYGGYTAYKGVKYGLYKMAENSDIAEEKETEKTIGYKKRAEAIEKAVGPDDREFLDNMGSNIKHFRNKTSRDIVEAELEGNFENVDDLMAYSALTAGNTVYGKSLAKSMARQQMLIDAQKNPSVEKDDKTLAKEYKTLTENFSEKIFGATSEMNPMDAAKFIHEAHEKLGVEFVKQKDGGKSYYAYTADGPGKPKTYEQELGELNRQIEDRYQKSLDSFEKVKKENPEVKEAGAKLKDDVVNTTFKSPKAKFLTNKIVDDRKTHKEIYEKTKESQIDKIVERDGCSRDVAAAQVKLRHNVQSAAKNLAYADMMTDQGHKIDKMSDEEKRKHMDKMAKQYETKIFTSLNKAADGYKEGSLTAEQKASIRNKAINDISDFASHAAARSAQPGNDGFSVEKNKYLTSANTYMQNIEKNAEKRRFNQGENVPKSVDIVSGAQLDEETSKRIKKLSELDNGFRQKLNFIQRETGGAEKPKSKNEVGNDFNYINKGRDD